MSGLSRLMALGEMARERQGWGQPAGSPDVDQRGADGAETISNLRKEISLQALRLESLKAENSCAQEVLLAERGRREKAEEELLGLRERHESMLGKMELLKRTVETLQYEKELFRESGERERDVAALQSDVRATVQALLVELRPCHATVEAEKEDMQRQSMLIASVGRERLELQNQLVQETAKREQLQSQLGSERLSLRTKEKMLDERNEQLQTALTRQAGLQEKLNAEIARSKNHRQKDGQLRLQLGGSDRTATQTQGAQETLEENGTEQSDGYDDLEDDFGDIYNDDEAMVGAGVGSLDGYAIDEVGGGRKEPGGEDSLDGDGREEVNAAQPPPPPDEPRGFPRGFGKPGGSSAPRALARIIDDHNDHRRTGRRQHVATTKRWSSTLGNWVQISDGQGAGNSAGSSPDKVACKGSNASEGTLVYSERSSRQSSKSSTKSASSPSSTGRSATAKKSKEVVKGRGRARVGVKLETAAEEEGEAVFADPGTDRRQRKSGAPPTQWSSTPGREVLADEATERSAVKLSPAKESSLPKGVAPSSAVSRVRGKSRTPSVLPVASPVKKEVMKAEFEDDDEEVTMRHHASSGGSPSKAVASPESPPSRMLARIKDDRDDHESTGRRKTTAMKKWSSSRGCYVDVDTNSTSSPDAGQGGGRYRSRSRSAASSMSSTKGAYSLGKTPADEGSEAGNYRGSRTRASAKAAGKEVAEDGEVVQPVEPERADASGEAAHRNGRKRALQQQGRINAKRPVLDAQSEGVDEEGSSDMMQTSPAKVQVKQEASDTSWWGQTRQSFGKFMRS